MAKRIQLRRGNTSQSNAFTGDVGEVTVDTSKNVLVVHDGTTAGGWGVAARSQQDGSITLFRKDGTVSGVIHEDGLFYNGTDSTNQARAATAAVAKNLQDQITNAFNQQFGVGQSWQDVTGNRASEVNYTNTTGKPIAVSIHTNRNWTGGAHVALHVNGLLVNKFDSEDVNDGQVFTIVPSGSSYSATIYNYTLGTSAFWRELR